MKNITLLALLFALGNALPVYAEESPNQSQAQATTVLPISDADAQTIYASVKKPTTLRELYDNYVIIKKNRLLLRADFYTTENIINFMGCKNVIWGVHNKGTKKATLIYSDAVNSYIGIMPPSNNKSATQYYGIGDTEKNNHISSRITLWDEETAINKKLNNIFSTQLNSLLPNMMDDVDLSTLIGGYIFYQNHNISQPIFMAKDEKLKFVYPKNSTDFLKNIKYALEKQLFLNSNFYSQTSLGYFFGDDDVFEDILIDSHKGTVRSDFSKYINKFIQRIDIYKNDKRVIVSIDVNWGDINVEDFFGMNWIELLPNKRDLSGIILTPDFYNYEMKYLINNNSSLYFYYSGSKFYSRGDSLYRIRIYQEQK